MLKYTVKNKFAYCERFSNMSCLFDYLNVISSVILRISFYNSDLLLFNERWLYFFFRYKVNFIVHSFNAATNKCYQNLHAQERLFHDVS